VARRAIDKTLRKSGAKVLSGRQGYPPPPFTGKTIFANSGFEAVEAALKTALLATAAHAVPAPFDLAGPTLDVKITRGAKTLSASAVPNLLAGDQLWIKADFPPTQSAHYLLVAAFLSGSTNPPPESWFFPCKTWTGKCGHDGLTVTVSPPVSGARS